MSVEDYIDLYEPDEDEPWPEFEGKKVHETEKAFLLYLVDYDEQYWFPKTQCHPTDRDEKFWKISPWILAQKEIEYDDEG